MRVCKNVVLGAVLATFLHTLVLFVSFSGDFTAYVSCLTFCQEATL